jgi:hypothetical protein
LVPKDSPSIQSKLKYQVIELLFPVEPLSPDI